MKTIRPILFLLLVSLSRDLYAQGFVNLNFESANVSGYGTFSSEVPTNKAIPGWLAYFPSATYGAQQSPIVAYNGISTGDATISIYDTNINSSFDSGFVPLQGKYSILFQGDYVPDNPPGSDFGNAAEIAQTGLVPVAAQSLFFWGNLEGVELLFNGQNIPYAAVGSGNNYTIYQADISGFAGQPATMGFLALVNGGGTLDNIQFSTTAVPEPSMFALTALGGLLLGFRRWRK